MASYSARGKQHIVLLRPFREGLVMHQLRYADEVKAWSEIPVGDLPEVKTAELALAKQIIAQITSDVFVPEKFRDDVKTRMSELIQKKIEGQEIVATPAAPVGKVIDLMEALKASLGMQDGTPLPAKAVDVAVAPKAKRTRKKEAT